MKTEEMLKRIAEINVVTVDEVKEDIQKSIQEAAKNPTSEFKNAFGGRVPSIEEFLSEMTSKVMDNLGN